MKLESVFDKSFREFGQVLEGYDFSELLEVLRRVPKPDAEVAYVPSDASLEATGAFGELRVRYFGDMPVQLGYCSGFNVKMNGFEYHRDSELNVAADDLILLLGRQADIEVPAYTYDTSKARAFLLPAGTGVEFYATTLHYAPGAAGPGGFRVAVALPRGTNVGKPKIAIKNSEDRLLAATNKWLIVHQEAAEPGLHVGLRGENIDVTPLWKK